MKFSERLEEYRFLHGDYLSKPHEPYGAFLMPGPCGEALTILADDGNGPGPASLQGWEHVSVSTRRRVPNWQEMCFVKSLFWGAEEWVVQYHPPLAENINNYSKCLHLWKPTRHALPTPPALLVGYKELGDPGMSTVIEFVRWWWPRHRRRCR